MKLEKHKNSLIVYTILCGIGSGINFLTLIVFGRMFTPDDYGIISAWQALIVNISALMIPLQYMICRALVETREEAKRDGSGQMQSNLRPDPQKQNIGEIIRLMIVINLVVTAAFVFGARPLAAYLHIERVNVYVLFAMTSLLFDLYVFYNGVPQGHQAFLFLGSIGILFYGGKLLFSYAFKTCGFGTTAVLAGQGSAELICFFLLLGFSKRKAAETGDASAGSGRHTLLSYLESFLLYFLVSLYMNNGDVLAANAYCDKERVGVYTVAVSLAKIAVFLIATPIGTVLLPKVTALQGNPGKQKKILLAAEAITAGGAMLYGLLYFCVGEWLIPLVYGEEYRNAGQYVPYACIFAVVLGIYWVYYQYCFASGRQTLFMYASLVGSIGAALIILIFKVELELILLVMTGGMLVNIFLTFFFGIVLTNICPNLRKDK